MFSGIIETTSQITQIRDSSSGRRVFIERPRGWRLHIGESVSVEGVCSTIESFDGLAFRVTYMPETLRRTTLGQLRRSDRVNLERSLTLSSLICGHLVQGHADARGRIRGVRPDGGAKIYEINVPPVLSRYIVEKGSIAVDGISLTVLESRSGRVKLSLLALTLAKTTLGGKGAGAFVNLEVDVLAKYIEKLVNTGRRK